LWWVPRLCSVPPSVLRRVPWLWRVPSLWVLGCVYGVGQVLLLLRLGIDRRLLAECDDADLHQTQQVRVRMGPLMQVGKIYLASSIHMLGHLHLHVRGWLHKGQRSMVRVGVQQPQRYGDVVCLSLIWDRYGTLQV